MCSCFFLSFPFKIRKNPFNKTRNRSPQLFFQQTTAPFHATFIVSWDLYISNGNRTEWSLIRSVIIRVINKIGRPRSGSPICLITSMITDRIGRHEVLLPINHNFNKICDIIGYFLNQNTRNSKFCFASSEKRKPFKRARDGACCPIT